MPDNSSNNKRIAKNTIFLYVRMLLIMLVTLYTARVVLRTLGVDDYGLYNVVGGVVSMFAFLNGTMSGATQRFLTFELGLKEKGNFTKVFGAAFTIHAFLALIIFVLAETIGLWFVCTKLTIPPERFSAALWVYHFSILSTLVFVMSIPFNACIISHERMGAFAYISIIEVILKLLIVFFLNLIDYDKLKLYAVLMFMVQVGIQSVYMLYCHRAFKSARVRLIWDRTLLSRIANFAGWTLFGGMASVGFNQGLNIVLNMFFGPAVNAARAIAVQVDNAIQSFVSNFQMAMNPQIIKRYAAGEMSEMHKLVFASSRYSFFLMLLFAIPIFIEAPEILNLWLDTVPEHTINFLRITIFVILINTLSNPLITSVNATGKVRNYQVIVGSILLMIVPITYFVLKVHSIPELAFVVYVVVSVIAQIARFLLARSLVDLSTIDYLKNVLLRIISVGLVSIILPVITAHLINNKYIELIAVCFVSWLTVFSVVYFLGIGKDERQIIKTYANKFLKR